MLLIIAIIAAIVLALFLAEYRLSRPDYIVLYESDGQVRRRRARIYPRHFSLTISAKVHSIVHTIEAEAKGRIPVQVKVAVTVAASLKHLSALIRVGGWNKDAVAQATRELEVMTSAFVREFTERNTIEDLSSEKMAKHVEGRLKESEAKLGLEVLAVNVQVVEPVDKKISEAIRQQEAARILEQTEIHNQNARVAAARVKSDADEQIAKYEHDLEMKKITLKKTQEEQEAALARDRVEEELKLKQMQLEIDQKEIQMLVDHPELLVLTPQVAQLAEASQNLRNARTVVSLSSKDLAEGSQFVGLLKKMLQNMIQSIEKKEVPDGESEP